MDNTNAQEELDLQYFLSIIFKRFWLLLGFVVIGVGSAILVNMFMRPMYEANVLLMINQENAGKIDTNTFASFSAEEGYYRTQYQLLESRSLLEKVYKQLELGNYEEFAGNKVGKLKKAIKITPITRSRLVNVSAKTYDPVLSADIANTLVETFVTDNLSSRISMGKDVIAALESTEKSKAQQELLNSMPQVVHSDFIKSLKQQATKLSGDAARLSAKYTDKHPEVISIQHQLASINNQIATETKRIIQSIKIELSGQFSANNVRIVDKAIVPKGPVTPRKLINLAIGLLGGGIIGLLLIFGIEIFDQSIKSADDIEQKLHLPFLGYIPYEKINKKTLEYSTLLKEGNFVVAENVRNIRTMLDFALTDASDDAFLIASAIQGEGKTHLSANLIVALAQTGKKVLLVDGDLRRSRLHQVFRLSNEKGLSRIWDKDSKIADYNANVQTVKDVPNLYVMTSGPRPPNPAELLNTPKLEDFINWAKKEFDNVVIDCPAIMPVTDTLLWGKYIPRSIFVTKYGHTNANLSKLAIGKLQKAGIKILGTVISQYRSEGLSYGKYGYYKNYHYYSEYK